MSKQLSNWQISALLVGSMAFALAVGGTLKLLMISSSKTPTAPTASESPESEVAFADSETAFQSGPFIPSAQNLQLADPGLLKSTSQAARLDTVVAGRPDPFSPVVRPSSLPTSKASPATVPAPPAIAVSTPQIPAAPQGPLPVVPVAATQALPPLPSLPIPANLPIPPVPSLGNNGTAVAALPQGVPQSLSVVDQIEISGVAQMGGQIRVILKESGSSSSRHVAVGETIAGGVKVKRVDLGSGDPVIVLEHQGQEHYRTVGSSAIAGLL